MIMNDVRRQSPMADIRTSVRGNLALRGQTEEVGATAE